MRYSEISKYLNDSEKLKLRRDVRRRIAKVYNRLPDDQTFKVACLSGIVKRGWYDRARTALRAFLGWYDAEIFSAVLAATSPQQTVRLNLLMTIRIYREWIKQGRPEHGDKLDKIARMSDLLARRLNVVRSFKGQALSGFKVNSFMNNLCGDLDSVTIDTWMLEFADLKDYSAGSKYVYLAYVAKIRKVAREMGLKPAEVQETIWSYIYSKVNKVSVRDVPEFSELLTTDDDIKKELDTLPNG